MDWLVDPESVWLTTRTTLGWLVGLTVVFGLLARLTPCNPGMYWWKNLRTVATDFVYWFIVPLFMVTCRKVMIIVGIALLFAGHEPGFALVKHLALWQQCLAILLIQDVLLYFSHRVFHTRMAWKFHAVHHSPTVLDWMSTSRFHPINLLLAGSSADVAVQLMGFSPAALVVLTPFNIVYSAMVHANLNWTFGPFKYFFASPVFHRWHHTTLAEGLNKNFAPTFPLLDVIFGTFYMPAGKLPEHFGDPDFPEGFCGQFLYPFRNAEGQGVVASARRRPIAASLLVGSVLAVGGLLAGGIYVLAQLAERNEQLVRDVEKAKLQQLQAETARHADHLDMARRAWAENDLVGAAVFLNGMAGSSFQAEEQQRLRDLCRRKCLILKGHARAVTSVAVSADEQTIVSGSDDGLVKVWDARTGQEKLSLAGHTRPVRSVAITADGLRIVSASFDGLVKVWDAHTGKEQLTLKGHTGAVLSMAVSGDGRRIVSGSADLTAKVWDAGGKEKFSLKGQSGAVPSVAMSGDGRCIVTANSATATVWDGETGEKKHTLKGHSDLVYSVAVSPDGKRIASASYDHTVKVWDAASFENLLTFDAHKGPVYSVAFADGLTIVSGGKDGLVKVWDVRTGREKLSLKGHMDSVTSVAASGAGRCIASGSADGTVAVWDARNCAVRDQVDLTRGN